MLRLLILDYIQSIVHMRLKQLRSGTRVNHSPSPATRRTIPIRDDLGISIFPFIPITKQMLYDFFVGILIQWSNTRKIFTQLMLQHHTDISAIDRRLRIPLIS